MSDQYKPHIRRCVNNGCRVNTYLGTWQSPFMQCPGCQMPGIEIKTETNLETKDSDDGN